jgi:flagellar biosynthesis regulator FlaF
MMLDQARADRSKLAEALETNMAVWVALRAVITRDDCTLSAPVKDNLVRLANFAASKALGDHAEVDEKALDSLINVNLQISEGLLEGATVAA